MQSTWEAAHSAALRELVEKGLPFSEVARSLNVRFGTAYTRNATIGRARRMGLSTPQRFNPASAFPAMKKPNAKRIRGKRASPVIKLAAKPNALERAAVLQLRCVAITPRHLALIDLAPDDCRYPYGGDAEGEPITFCGHPRREGSSYCTSHFHLTRLPELVEKREGARTPLRLVEAA
jgi:GcrA cell cycle regulator